MSTKDCPPDQIRNPATKRCVKRTGAIGRRVLKEMAKQPPPPPRQVTPTPPPPLPAAPPYRPFARPTHGMMRVPLLPTRPSMRAAAPQMPVKREVASSSSSSSQGPKRVNDMKLQKVPLSLEINNNNDPTKLEARVKRTPNASITLVQFEALLDTPAFITRFRQAILNLLAYKQNLYKNKKMLPKMIADAPGAAKTPAPQLNVYEIIEAEIKTQMVKLKGEGADDIVKKNLKKAINDKKFGMKSLIGRDKIMDKLAGILYAFSNNYKIFTRVFMNFSIFGSAGVGKTALAKVLSHVFKHSFLLTRGKVIMATRQELIGQFVGSTAVKTRNALFDSLESILFIDEAYSLTPCPDTNLKDYGGEAIAELINFMDKTMGLMVIMVAGYEREMKVCFFPFNEGLDRRFPNKITLDKYNNEQLTQIMIMNLSECDVQIDEKTRNLLYTIISRFNEVSPLILKNQAGDILNFANAITQSIYMSYNNVWNRSDTDNRDIIFSATEDFLESKDFHIDFAA